MTLDVDVVPDPERGNIAGVPSFAELEAEAVDTHHGDVPVRICSLRHLRAMKEVAGRPRDLADLAELPVE